MRSILFICASTFALAQPAFAQDAQPDPNRDTLTIGLGAASVPRYEGSDDNTIVPAGAIRGKVSGISFATLGTTLFVDLVPMHSATGTKFVLGPVAHVTLDRTNIKRTRNPQIVALGKIGTAVELGGHVGLSRTGVITSDYDTLSADVAVTHDITGTHRSTIVTPSLTYATPLSTSLYVGVSVAADYVGDGYARKYFGVTPAQSVASGLATYTPGSGFKDINFGLLGGVSLSGDLRRGASIFLIGNYEKLLGDFGRSPVVRDRNQWFGGVGLAYTF